MGSIFVVMPAALPVIDLSGADDPARRARSARALFDGIAGSACVWIEGHGVPDDLMADVVDVSRRFFAQPRPTKAEVEWDGQGLWRGWQPAIEGAGRYGGEARRTDLFERLEQNFTPSTGGVDRQGNRWPSEPAALRPIWERYARHLGDVSCGIVRLLAEVLELPADLLEPWTEGRSCNLVANHYPAVPAEATEGRLRLQAHADHSGITVLMVDDAPGGLESRDAQGRWHEVHQRPGALLVQAGTLLQRWTNGLLPPNVHRVRPPAPGALGRPDRLSMAWFHYPDPEVVVEPAPSCVGTDGARFAPVPAGSYAASRQAAYRRGEATTV
jgi:isopenicillin N synthase-like dioxygenase